jgi:hypothetical protein
MHFLVGLLRLFRIFGMLIFRPGLNFSVIGARSDRGSIGSPRGKDGALLCRRERWMAYDVLVMIEVP